MKLGKFLRSAKALTLLLIVSACGQEAAQTAQKAAAECINVAAAAAPTMPRPRKQSGVGYRPDCGENADCAAWRTFRQDHPYPYQAFAGQGVSGGRAVLVVSEPPPEIDRATALEMLRQSFADRKPETATRRWMIGTDGYVEDLTVSFDAPELQGNDLLSSPELRDRVATLQAMWFGTACGGDVEVIGDGSARTPGVAPNLQINAAELKAWLADAKLTWLPIETEAQVPEAWAGLAEAQPQGAYLSADRSLGLLTLKAETLRDPSKLASLKSDFRRFAVSTDAILGVVWTPEGQMGIVGRARAHPLSQIAPLRFETFQLLAAQREDALHQSYERNNPLAGRLWSQERDWAPIFLSDALIDTEFGALLNVTDQMLKSWSERGTIDYVYFDYPLKPNTFPFEKNLSSHVTDETKSNSTLFNWNTSGSAVAVQTADLTLMVGRQLGSLPVTYGSDAQGDGEMETGGKLVGFENKAYDYFSGLGDPNLARVVQYTLLYQAFRNMSYAQVPSSESTPPKAVLRPETETLRDRLAMLLSKLPSPAPGDTGEGNPLSDTIAKLTAIRTAFPHLPDADIALLLVDRGNGNQLISKAAEDAIIGGATNEGGVRQRFNTLLRDVTSLGASMQQLLLALQMPLEPIRSAFEQASARRPQAGWIRTPSHVVSWGPTGIGGHNIDARALRFEVDESVSGIEATSDGRVLYPSSESAKIQGRATEIARAVEHGRATPAELRAIANAVSAERPRWQALGLKAEAAPPRVAARLGGRSYTETAQFVKELETLKAQVSCCRIMGRDKTGRSLIVETNPKAPPPSRVLGFGDNASLGAYLRRGEGTPADVIMLDQPLNHVDALMTGASASIEPPGVIAGIRRWFGRRPRAGSAQDHIVGPDLHGRRGFLSAPAEGLPAARLKLLGKARGETLRAARLEKLPEADLEQWLRQIGWSRDVDGLPNAVRISYQSAEGTNVLDVVAGFVGPNASAGPSQLRSAVDGALAAVGTETRQLVSVQMTIKNNLMRLNNAAVGRIVFIRRSGSDRIQFTRNLWNAGAPRIS